MSKAKGQQAEPAKQEVCQAVCQKWYGVQNTVSGDWAKANSMVVCYPCKEAAEAHCVGMGERWKATPFAT